jgi:non-heme chloroperoxidase
MLLIVLVVLFAVLAVLLLGHWWAKRATARLRANPDVYPPEILSREPQGETVFIVRPDGTRLRAVVAGKGPVVVLAHAYSVTLQEWNVVFDHLVQAGFRVITFDQRGHGDSTIGSDGLGSRQMAGDYQAILEHFEVRDAILVGHSMGGFLSLVFMLTSPAIAAERLRGVVLFATTAGNAIKGSLQNRVQIPMIRYGLMQRIARSPTYGSLFARSLFGEKPSPVGIQVFLDMFKRQDYRALMPILNALAYEDYYPRLGEIRIPCVVICGKKDRTTPPWHSQRMAAEIPNARAVWVEGRGHLLNWEAPETLVEAVRSLQPVATQGGQVLPTGTHPE